MNQSHMPEVVEIAANLDDASGEVLGAAIDALLEAGALDVWTTSIGMKKQRPGVCLSLLCRPEQRDDLAQRMIELTGTFGVRHRAWGRVELDRRHETVTTDFGDIRIKVGSLHGRDVTAKVEFDDAVQAAAAHGATARQVVAAAMAAWCGRGGCS